MDDYADLDMNLKDDEWRGGRREPRERSGDRGVPASERAGGPRGEAPGSKEEAQREMDDYADLDMNFKDDE